MGLLQVRLLQVNPGFGAATAAAVAMAFLRVSEVPMSAERGSCPAASALPGHVAVHACCRVQRCRVQQAPKARPQCMATGAQGHGQHSRGAASAETAWCFFFKATGPRTLRVAAQTWRGALARRGEQPVSKGARVEWQHYSWAEHWDRVMADHQGVCGPGQLELLMPQKDFTAHSNGMGDQQTVGGERGA